MELELYQIDAFADASFTGNPAAVIPLTEWLEEDVMQSIAAENNLAETAFFVYQSDNQYQIRWFTPMVEVDLCGHATLASAYVLFNELNTTAHQLVFNSMSGPLRVEKITKHDKELIELDFPSQPPVECDEPEGLADSLGVGIVTCLCDEIYIVLLEDEDEVAQVTPNFSKLLQLGIRGVVVTATSEQYDFVNRYFAPLIGINEDSVTGSAFSKLIPYWSKRLNKKSMTAKQISHRGGEVFCELVEDRVKIAGTCVKYMQGTITI